MGCLKTREAFEDTFSRGTVVVSTIGTEALGLKAKIGEFQNAAGGVQMKELK